VQTTSSQEPTFLDGKTSFITSREEESSPASSRADLRHASVWFPT
jgi:hypothetical protein